MIPPYRRLLAGRGPGRMLYGSLPPLPSPPPPAAGPPAGQPPGRGRRGRWGWQIPAVVFVCELAAFTVWHVRAPVWLLAVLAIGNTVAGASVVLWVRRDR